MKTLVKVMTTGLALVASSAIAQEKIRMATISPGSSAYLVMTTMASAVNTVQNDYEIVVDAVGPETKHMIDAAQGRLDIVTTSPAVMDFMQQGTEMYSKLSNAPDLRENLSLIYWFPTGAYHAATRADSGIEALSDLKGKKVYLGPVGGGSFNAAKQWIEANTDLKIGQDYTAVNANWGVAAQSFEAGEIDVFFSTGIAPFPLVEQLSQTNRLRLLGLTKRQADDARKKDAVVDSLRTIGHELAEIRVGAYGDRVVNVAPLFTLGTTAGVVARADLDETAVYNITKAFWESLPELQRDVQFMEQVTLKGAFSETNVKLHTGAVKFYKEIGMRIPDQLL